MWKSFELAIRRINRPVVVTKISNRILAVNYIQQLRGYCTSNKYMHCNNVETVAHLYHCNHVNRKGWRLSYISGLRKKLKEIKTDESLIDAIASILSEYLDLGEVTVSKYNSRFHNAIRSQGYIGFGHFFLGKISQQWLDLFLPHIPSDPSHPDRYKWGSQVVEFTLRKMINLWEIRNKDVHGNTDKEIEEIKKRRVTAEILQYFELRQKCCVYNRDLFPEDNTEFINKNNSRTLLDWILSNKGWIAASIKRKKKGDHGSGPIIPWLAHNDVNDAECIRRVKENRRRQLLREQEREENKKRLRKKKREQKLKLKLQPKSKRATVKYYYKVISRPCNKAKHTTKKKHENDSRKKKRLKSGITRSITEYLSQMKDKIVSSVLSDKG